MSCSDLLRRLTEYEDGVLSADLCGALEEHFRDCLRCAELRRDLATLHALCHQESPLPMPVALRERLRQALQGQGGSG